MAKSMLGFSFIVFSNLFKFSLANIFNDDFTAFPGNIINRNFNTISPPHCQWLMKHCGKTDFNPTSQPVMKIYGGEVAQLGQLPWVVHVRTQIKVHLVIYQPGTMPMITTETRNPECSGTLISEMHVLTAAHCLYNKVIKYTHARNSTVYTMETHFKAKLRMGDVDVLSEKMTKGEETARFVSPDFSLDATYTVHDYAVIEFAPPIDEADMAKFGSTLRPACLPDHGLQIAEIFRISGWGVTDVLPYGATILETTTVTKKQCFFHPLGVYPLEVCTTHSAGLGDSGCGYIQQNNDRATVVAVQHSYNKNTTLNEQRATLLIAPTHTGAIHVCVPMQWIQKNTWPIDMTCYADTTV